MYSRIPVPRVSWTEENRRYALCFFPLVGAAVGGAEILWFLIYKALGFNSLLFGAGAAAIPIIVTGGIHADGFCDVCDALASWGGKEKMLEIMLDPHIGSFAAVRAALYAVFQTGLFAEVKDLRQAFVIALIFVQSRALSGLGAVTLKSAKKDGALQSFKKAADRRAVITSEIAVLTLTVTFAVLSDALCALCAFGAEMISFARYKRLAYKKFGGVTGDAAGYFLQICEISAMFSCVFADLARGIFI